MAKARMPYLPLCFALGVAACSGLFLSGMQAPVVLACGFAGLLALAMLLFFRNGRCLDFVIRHRHIIALIVLAVLVLLEISGSSIALWGPALGEDALTGTLFGKPRTDRSDEWMVFTPFSLSQDKTGFSAVSDVIRGGDTDVTMVYAQPCLSVATIFRPFLWGYMVLGPARGLSMFWCGRAIALVLVTYDTMALLTAVADQDVTGEATRTDSQPGRTPLGYSSRLAAYGALLVAFAPIVEWWFAVNGTVELLVFGQGLVLALHHLLRGRSGLDRWVFSALLAWLLGCYAFIIYPAWQVPFVYVFASMGFWDFCSWLRETKHTGRPSFLAFFVPLVCFVAAAAAGIAYSLYGAADAIRAVSETVYPGERFFTGGGLAPYLPNSLTSLLSPLWPQKFQPNACEAATFVSLFPLGLMLACALLLHGICTRHPDGCLAWLLCPYILLLVFGLVGLPTELARITLLSNVMPARLPFALGYLDVALLIRALAVGRLAARRAAAKPKKPARPVARSVDGKRRRNPDESLPTLPALPAATGTIASADERIDTESTMAGLFVPVDTYATDALNVAGSHAEATEEVAAEAVETPKPVKPLAFVMRLVLLALLVAGFVYAAYWYNAELMSVEASVLLAASVALLLVPLILPAGAFAQAPSDRGSYLVASALVVVVAGLCVNPVQQGIGPVTSSRILSQVQTIVSDNPQALWITDDSQLGQACIMAGARTITSVNCYPAMDRWHTLDPRGRFEEAYNRYAHFRLSLDDEVSFSNPQPDVCTVTLPVDDVPKLGVSYWLSRQPLDERSTDTVRFEPVIGFGNVTIYRIETGFVLDEE